MDGEIIMTRILPVPYISQRRKTADPFWLERACGVFSLAMILGYFGKKDVSIEDLLEEGTKAGGYIPNIGWKHDVLVELARNHGIEMERKEYKATDLAQRAALLGAGEEDITRAVEEGRPVVISVTRPSGSSHLAVVVGYDKKEGHEGFYVHDFDPDAEGSGESQFVPKTMFESTWRRLAIFCQNGPAK